MKTLLICLMISATIQPLCYSQKVSIGIEGGPNISTLRGKHLTDNAYDPKLFYTLGAYSDYAIAKHVNLKLGAFYQLKGAKTDVSLTVNTGTEIGTYESRETFRYITIPFLVKYQLGHTVQCM